MSSKLSLEEKIEIVNSAEEFASYVSKKWPQVNENGEINYSFVGSLAVLLLTPAKSIQPINSAFNETKEIPARVREKLYSFTRPIGDMDYLPSSDYLKLPLSQRLGKGGGGPSIAELPENAKKALVLPENMCKFMCDPVDNYGSNEIVKIIGNKNSYLIQSPKNMFGYKILNSTQSFHMKPEKFKKDFNILHSAFSEICSLNDLLDSSYRVLSGYEKAISQNYGPKVRGMVNQLYAHDEFNGKLKGFFDDLRKFEIDNNFGELVQPLVGDITQTNLKVGFL